MNSRFLFSSSIFPGNSRLSNFFVTNPSSSIACFTNAELFFNHTNIMSAEDGEKLSSHNTMRVAVLGLHARTKV